MKATPSKKETPTPPETYTGKTGTAPKIGDTPKVADVSQPWTKTKVTEAELRKFMQRRKIPQSARGKAMRTLRRRKWLASLPKGKDISYSQADFPWQVIYGRCKVGAARTFLHQAGTTKEKLYNVLTFACHEVSAVGTLILDGNTILFADAPGSLWATGATKPDGSSTSQYNNRVFLQTNVGTVAQTALSQFVADIPAYWTSDHKQSNRAHCGMILVYNGEAFPDGDPDVTLEVYGKPLYDPRSDTTTYSNNAALVIADFITDPVFGLGEHFDWDAIDTDSLEDAADICDESVSLAGGGTEARYTTNHKFSCDQDRETTLSDLESAFGGFVEYINGKWKFFPATYRTPSVTLTEDDLRSIPELDLLLPESDSMNSVKGRFVSYDNDFEVTDFPAVSVSAYVTADNGKKLWGEILLPATTSSPMAQRLARIELERARRQKTIRASWGLKALQLQPGDVVYVTISRYGFSAKTFEVEDWELGLDQSMAVVVRLTLRETDSGVYSWTPGTDEQQINIAPSTTLPDLRIVTAPSGFTLASGTAHLDLRLDGTIFSRIYASWTQSAEAYVTQGGRVEIQYKKSASSDWIANTSMSGDASFAYILDVKDGVNYDVRVRFVNAVGVPSSWSTVSGHNVQGKTAPPSDVTGFAATVSDLGINFNWDAISDIDAKDYEIREGSTWGSATVIGRTDSSAGANSFLYEYRTAGTYTFLIKARDTSLGYSTNAASASVTIQNPNPIEALTPKVLRNNVMLDWVEGVPSTLTVIEYNIYKGDTEETSTKIGTVFGTFHTYIEQYGGTFTYWVEAVDVGGNKSTKVSASATITATNDFFINADQDLLDDLTATYFAVELEDAIFAPVGQITASLPLFLNPQPHYETWSEHFANNGWTTTQDAIDDGFSAYLSPAPLIAAYVEFEYDFTVTFGSSFIDFSWSQVALDPAGAGLIVTPSLSVSLDGATWTEYAGTAQVFAENFRYVKFRLAIEALDALSVSRFEDFRAVLSLQRDTETQIVTANAADSGGTTVTFNTEFVDVESIHVSANSTIAASPVYDYDFSVVPAAPTMKVLVFDKDGNRVTKEVTITIRGAVAGA